MKGISALIAAVIILSIAIISATIIGLLFISEKASILERFSYRRAIIINNANNAKSLANYQVLVTIDTASLISAGKMKSDCGDIRFTDLDGNTLLNYWIESGCNSASTKIWVKVPSIPNSSTKKFIFIMEILLLLQ